MSDVSVVILAGGMGTRLAEETSLRPKPMVEISGKPLLWHLMNIYSAHGFDDFVLACGYKSEFIKEYLSLKSKASQIQMTAEPKPV